MLSAWLAMVRAREALAKFRSRGLTPEAPVARGMAENGDVFFQHREACNSTYAAVPEIVEEYMNFAGDLIHVGDHQEQTL